MSLVWNILIGVVIGIGFIIPGVSGGALAVIMGVYDKIFECLKTIKDKNNFIFLGCILLGITIGVIGFGNILLILFKWREIPTKYIFIGLIIGGIPTLMNDIQKKGHGQFKLSSFVFAIIISIFLFFLEESGYGIDISEEIISGNVPIVGLFIAGLLYAVGKIVPGISGSALLMLVGMYEYFLRVVANPFALTGKVIFSLIPFFIGTIIGLFLLFKLINYLFSKHYMATYSAILGFVIGSLLYLYPGFTFNISGLVCIILLISSAIFSYMITK